MNEIQIFKNEEFGEVRIIDIDGKPHAGATDVARALGYTNPHDAILRHCKGVVKREGVSQTTNQHGVTTEQTVEMNFIPEGDVYRLIVRSQLPSAEKFERWVFEEVLPSIRKHGAYMTPDTLDRMISTPEFGIKLLTALKDEQDKNKALQSDNSRLIQENDKQKQIIGELKPAKDYVDYILSSTGTMAITQIAADYGMSAQRLNKILWEENVQRPVNGQWILYAVHMDKGYTKSDTIPIERSDGRPDTKLHTKWTQKGRLYINDVLNRRGIVANMDIGRSVQAA